MNSSFTQPRFRTDLVAKPLDEDGQRYIDVTDPDSGKTFRFYEVEYSIACAMDGNRNLADLAEWAQVELGLDPSPDELNTVIATLAELGYLDSSAQATSGHAPGNTGGGAFDLGHAGASAEGEPEMPLPSPEDIELGSAGKSPLEVDQDDALEVADIALGVMDHEAEVEALEPPLPLEPSAVEAGEAAPLPEQPGDFPEPVAFQEPPPPLEEVEAKPVLQPVSKASDADDDGPTNLPPPAPPPSDFEDEVSLNLTDHMHLGPDALKEAVRQSQAIDVPQDVVDKLPPADGVAAGDQPSSPAAGAVEAPAATGSASSAPPPPAPVPASAPPAPTELPDRPASISASMNAQNEGAAVEFPGPVEKKSRLGIYLLLLLLVAAGLAGAYYELVYKPTYQQATEVAAPTTAVPTTPAPVEPPEPVEPPPPEAVLARQDRDPIEVKMPRTGRVATIVAADTEVEEGDIVAKLNGYKGVETRLDKYEVDEKRYEKRIADAERRKATAAARGNANAAKKHQRDITLNQRKIEERRQAADDLRNELERFLLRSPTSGTIKTELAANARVTADQTVFSVAIAPVLVATFAISEGPSFEQGAEVSLAAKADTSKTGTCTITVVQDEQVTVECPQEGAFGEGEAVILP